MLPPDSGYEMTLPHGQLHTFQYCFWTGLGLMNFALFLQPMDPIDFLVLVFSDPLRTVSESYGIQAVVLFWISAGLLACGFAGMTCRTKIFQELTAPRTSSPQMTVNSKP